MNKIEDLLNKFQAIVENPRKQLDLYLSQGKKVIGCFPYYAPEELVHAAGMVPFGIWGKFGTPKKAKKYFATFYCSLAQMNMEMGLEGELDDLSGVIVTTYCDTLRPLSQNFRVGVPQIPFMFLAMGQNRRAEYGKKYTEYQYSNVCKQLETISGEEITDDMLRDAIHVYNVSRAERRRFVKLAGLHPELVSPIKRSAVLKSAYFMLKPEHTAMLKELNDELEAAPEKDWNGIKVVTSGILVDNPQLLQIFENHNIAIVADDVAHESRPIRVDVRESGDPMQALAEQYADQNDDPLLYDPTINSRHRHVANLVKESGAQGLVLVMMAFCDPEEMEYPSLKQELEKENIPHVKFGYDHQMKDFGQADTSLQTFADLLN